MGKVEAQAGWCCSPAEGRIDGHCYSMMTVHTQCRCRCNDLDIIWC